MAKKILIKFKPEVVNNDLPEETKEQLEQMLTPSTIVRLDQPVAEPVAQKPIENGVVPVTPGGTFVAPRIENEKDQYLLNGPVVEARSGFLSHETNDPIVSAVQNKMEDEYGEMIGYLKKGCFTSIPELLVDTKNVDIIEPTEIPPSLFFGSTVMHSRHSTYNAVFSTPELCAKDSEAYKTLIMHNFKFTARGLLTDMVRSISIAYNGIIDKHLKEEAKEIIKSSECYYDDPPGCAINFINIYPDAIPQIDYLSNLTTFTYDTESRSIGISQNTLNTYVAVFSNYCERTFLSQLNTLIRNVLSQNPAVANTFFVNVVADVSWFRMEFERFIMATLIELVTIAKMHIEAIEQHLHEPAPQKSQLKDPPYKINPYFAG